jgi:hypothetical protein
LCVPILDFPGVEWSTMQSLGEEILAERLTPWRERYRKVRVRTIVVCDRPAHQPVEQSESAQLASSAVTAESGSRECFLVRSAPRWSTPHVYRSSSPVNRDGRWRSPIRRWRSIPVVHR